MSLIKIYLYYQTSNLNCVKNIEKDKSYILVSFVLFNHKRKLLKMTYLK